MKTIAFSPASFSLIAFAAAPAIADTPNEGDLVLSLGGVGSGCPDVTIAQSYRYVEGGVEVSGEVKLAAIAGPAVFLASDDESVTWSAPLSPAFRGCASSVGAGGLFEIDATNGRLIFTLTTEEANRKWPDFVTTITYQNIRSGNPVFRYAVAD